MTNQIGMIVYHSPYGKRSRGKRFGFIAQWKLRQRRKHTCDLEAARRWNGL